MLLSLDQSIHGLFATPPALSRELFSCLFFSISVFGDG
jgi:hypothetical protein